MTTAYPFEIHLGPIPITGFGIMMMLAFLMGGWLIDRECRRLGFAPDYAGDIIVGAVVGGIIGAKLWFVAIHPEAPLFSRGGLVWYGGFVGGALGVVINGWRRRVPMAWTAHLVAPALAAAYAIGRIGCYVVGDDYGIPTKLPWGVKFPQGKPPTTAGDLRAFNVHVAANIPDGTLLAVHPTQLYEITAMTFVFALLWKWRVGTRGTGWLFGAYLALAGAERFAVEFLRAKDDRLAPGALSIAQVASLVVVAIGIAVMLWRARAARVDPGQWLERGSPPAVSETPARA